ncbi:MAG: pectinesterase [Myxococcales bacterium]|nr:pectinesterase [Myxococcales bacterium]
MQRPLLLLAALMMGLGGLPACSNGETGGGGEGAGEAGGGGDDTSPKLPRLDAGWTELMPEGTICGRGDPYSFWVRPGTTNRLIIEFVGGGACWDQLTCQLSAALFTDDVRHVRDTVEADTQTGFFNQVSSLNPFRDYYHVLITYCTGDIHWGDATVTYGTGADAFTIHHRGANNARAALAWVYDQFSGPETILVAGTSAGSYGAALWSADIMRHYPASKIYQFGDSGVGIITESFFRDSFPSWNAEPAFPAFIPELDPAAIDVQSLTMADIYVAVADHFPEHRLSQFTAAHDAVQVGYFVLMGGAGVEAWESEMLASLGDIEARTSNFWSFVAPGEQHGITWVDNFYSVHSGGVRLLDWIEDFIGDRSMASARCQGSECDMPTP